MRVLTHVFAGAGTVDYQIPGKYLRLIQTAAAVDIVPLDGMREIESEKGFNVEAGYATRPPGGFDGVRITASGAQTVRFAISNGSGDYNRLSGDVNILSSSVTLPVSIAGTVNVAGPLTDAQLRATPPFVAQRNKYTQSAVGTAITTANVAVALITPASNPNGMMLIAAQFSAVSAGGNVTGKHALIAHTSAPGAMGTGDVIVIGANNNGSAAGTLQAPIYVAAGKGIYYITDNNEQMSYRSALYEPF